MLQYLLPSKRCRLAIATIPLDPTHGDLRFCFTAKVETVVRFLRKVDNPEIRGNANGTCYLYCVNTCNRHATDCRGGKDILRPGQ